VAAGGLLGWLADEFLFGSYPTGLIIGVVAGLIVGLATLIRSALKYSRESSRDSRWTGGRLEVVEEPEEGKDEADDRWADMDGEGSAKRDGDAS
jgi:hypothetical protein